MQFPELLCKQASAQVIIEKIEYLIETLPRSKTNISLTCWKFWPHMANDAFNSIGNCPASARKSKRQTLKRKLQIFSAKGRHESSAIGNLRMLTRTKRGSRHVTGKINQHTKLARAILASSTTTTLVTFWFFESWNISCCTLTQFLTDKSIQFIRNMFFTPSTLLGVNHVAAIEYYPQTNERVEEYNWTKITRLRHYVDKKRWDQDAFGQSLVYGYNTEICSSSEKLPFSLLVIHHPPGPKTASSPNAITSKKWVEWSPRSIQLLLENRIVELRKQTDTRWREEWAKYRWGYSARLTAELKFANYWLSCLGNSPLAASTPISDIMVIFSYNKLQLWTTGRYRKVKIRRNTIVINGNGVNNTVAIHLISHSPRTMPNDGENTTNT